MGEGVDGRAGVKIDYSNKKPKMACFLLLKFLITLKLDFNGGVNFIKKYYILVISKSRKSNFKIVKFVVKNFEHLRLKVWSWKFWTFVSRINKKTIKNKIAQ